MGAALETTADDAPASRAPIFLLGDSVPLFGRTIFRDVPGLPPRRALPQGEPRCWWDAIVGGVLDAQYPNRRRRVACYLGASNGDEPMFFQMFVEAATRIGIEQGDCHHVTATPSAAEVRCVAEEAALILLAGGDPLAGWRSFQSAGLDAALRTAHARGAVLVGISAGAEHLGSHGYVEPPDERLPNVAAS